LRNDPLPLRTLALLMQHYERTGEFAKAEDELFAMLDAAGRRQSASRRSGGWAETTSASVIMTFGKCGNTSDRGRK
jgi:hypothetical protein